jgi:hypothetical protein
MADKPIIAVQAAEAPDFLQASSWLVYNDLLLADVLTEQYETQEIRTADQAQVTSVHHIIKVTGILNPVVNAYRTSDGNGTFGGRVPVNLAGIANNINIVRDQLMKDRGILRFALGGTIIVDSPSFRPNAPTSRFPCDNMEGPKPLYCQITQITGTSSFFVRFGIETWTSKCIDTYKYIQSHRFSMAHDVDGDTWLTTRMVQGRLKFYPEWLQLVGTFPHQVQAVWAHPVPPGFKRGNVKVEAMPNGMELAYSFVDTEQTMPLGSLSPATKLTAEFSIASSLAQGKPALTQAACHVSAVGPKNQFRFNLLSMALRIAMRKLIKPGAMTVTDIVVSYSLDNTFVDLSAKALWKPVGIGLEGLQLNNTGLTADEDVGDLDAALSPFRGVGEAPQGSMPDKALAPMMRNSETMGSYAGFVLGSSIVNGCFTAPKQLQNKIWDGTISGKTLKDEMPVEVAAFSSIDDDGVPIPFQLKVVPKLTIATASTGYSPESVNGYGLYEAWEMDTRYHTNHQRAVMPVGLTQGASPGDVLTFVPPEIATLGFPYTLKVVNWTVAWIGPNPAGIILPGPDTGDATDYLLAEDISPAVPGICNSSNKSWRISGTYWYACRALHTSSITEKTRFDYVDGGIAIGKSITDPSTRAANTVNITKFAAGYSPSYVG